MLTKAGTQNTYTCNVRIANWNEDRELNTLKTKEYLRKKERGELLVHQVQSLLNKSLQEVGLSYSKDGYVHYGDHIMLYSVATEGVVSVDMSTPIASADKQGAYSVTSSTLTQAPVARNVFVIEPYGDQRNGDVLRLGQPFRLRTNPKLATAWLQSQPVGTMTFAKQSHNQEVCVVPDNRTYDTVWVAQYKDIDQRFEMEGKEVPSNAEIIIHHAATKAGLASSKSHKAFNDFGQEFEVCSFSHITNHKKQTLGQEKSGLSTTDIPVRTEASNNHFAFLTASVPELDPSNQSAEEAPAAGEASF
jgi:hypothetical protein